MADKKAAAGRNSDSMRGEECGESSSPIIPDSEGEVNMNEQELLIVIRVMAEKISMLEWELARAKEANGK
jgi:hypothetical protein